MEDKIKEKSLGWSLKKIDIWSNKNFVQAEF